MSSAEEFKGAVKRLMQQSGSLGIVQAQVQFKIAPDVRKTSLVECDSATWVQVRAEILNAVYSGEARQRSKQAEPESTLLNELIREYLGFQGYDAAASVFAKEAQLDDKALPRASLELNFAASCDGHESRLPLLYALLHRSRTQGAGKL